MDTSNLNSTEFTVLKDSSILYLEDDEVIRKETSSIFEKIFKKVYTAEDGLVGSNLYNLEKDNIDIILTDINMPNKDGIEFMSDVRELDLEIPILIVTAFNDIDILIKAIKLNVTDYIIKPMQLNSTLKILNKVLQDKLNQKLLVKQNHELEIYKDILDKENLISETDPKGIITYVNDIFCEISGYKKEELIGKSHNILRHPSISTRLYEELWKTINNKEIWKGRIKNRAKDGSAFYVRSTIFPVLDKNENIEKFVASRFLITDQEEEKHKLKKYIMHQKSQQVKHEKQLQEEFEEAVHAAKMQKDEQVAKFFNELNSQIRHLREKNANDKGRILSLEKKLKNALTKNDELQEGYQKRIEKLHQTAVISVERYQKFKKKNAIITEKIEKSQEAIKTLQGYIDEYREKITNLEDLIEAYEKQYGRITVKE